MNGPRYDVIVAPSGEQVAVRDADGELAIVGKRFNAFAAEQWLAADGDGRDPADARDPDSPCDRLGCVARAARGRVARASSIDRLAFEEDCARADDPRQRDDRAGRMRGEVRLDERRLARTGAVGLDWRRRAASRSRPTARATEDRPWSPAPAPARDERIVRPGHATAHGAEPGEEGENLQDPGSAGSLK